jgi:hypothetical protein
MLWLELSGSRKIGHDRFTSLDRDIQRRAIENRIDVRRGPTAASRNESLKAKVRPIRFRDLRHTTGSLLRMAGANPAAAQRILRHSDPRFTTEVYGYLLPGHLKAAIDRHSFPGVFKMSPAESAARRSFATMLLQSPQHRVRATPGRRREAPQTQALASVGQDRLELSANGLRVRCSTN